MSVGIVRSRTKATQFVCLLSPRQTRKLEDHPLLGFCYSLFSLFAAIPSVAGGLLL
jgi:hypothetical protein